jgi:phosphoglycerate dehydrogenase-like enzyme
MPRLRLKRIPGRYRSVGKSVALSVAMSGVVTLLATVRVLGISFDMLAIWQAAWQGRGGLLSTSSGVYAEPCAQHVLAMMLAESRRLPQAHEVQRTDRSWPGDELRRQSRLLRGQTVLLLGCGAIARRLVELLAPFDMRIIAYRRSIRGDEPCPVVCGTELAQWLPQADHVVNLLPANEQTRRFVSRERFEQMGRGAIFYNIGRGTTVDQDALLEALHSSRLAAAYLDVTDPEPLPPQHPLWREPNCHITPHTAGGHDDEPRRLVRHFLENLRRFTSGEELLDRVI